MIVAVAVGAAALKLLFGLGPGEILIIAIFSILAFLRRQRTW
jgi:hypothetical protein